MNIRNSIAIFLSTILVAACNRGMSETDQEALQKARLAQYATLHSAAAALQEAEKAYIVDVKVEENDAGHILIRVRTAEAPSGKKIADSFCSLAGEALPAGTVRVQVFNAAQTTVEGVGYCRDRSGQAEKFAKLRTLN